MKVNEKVDMVEVEVMISYTLIANTNIIKVMEPHDLCKLLSGLLFLEQDLDVNYFRPSKLEIIARNYLRDIQVNCSICMYSSLK